MDTRKQRRDSQSSSDKKKIDKIKEEIAKLKSIKANLKNKKVVKLGVKKGDRINASNTIANNNFLNKYDSKLAALKMKLSDATVRTRPPKINDSGLTPTRKLAKDESKISRSTTMGGRPGGAKKKVVKKKKVVAKKYNPRKANRAGQKYGQR
jgi:hypothetical protein